MGVIQRWALGLEYWGGPFAGWQRQLGPVTVQEALEQALSQIAAAPIVVTVAGRTDAGVHALQQVVHFDAPCARSPVAWVRGANRFLPEAVSVLWAQAVPPDFHARFSATGRTYRYLILNRRERPGLMAGRYTWQPVPLDREAMQTAADTLIGRHDFSAFRAAACQAKSPVRTLRRLQIWRRESLLGMEVEADGFLHHMVRNLAGTLMAVGKGERPISWVPEVLASRDRRQAAMTAAPDGLYFVAPHYPDHYALPWVPNSAP